MSPQRCQRRSPGALSYTERSSTPLALKPNIEGREGERGGWCRSGSFPTDNAIISAPLVRNARFHRPLPSSERRSQHLQRVCLPSTFSSSRRPSTLSAPAWPLIPVGHRACLPFLRIQLPPPTKFQWAWSILWLSTVIFARGKWPVVICSKLLVKYVAQAWANYNSGGHIGP